MARWDLYSALNTVLGTLTVLARDSGQANPADEIRTVTLAKLAEFFGTEGSLFASVAETLTGTNTTKAVSPDRLNEIVTRIPRSGQMLNGKISVTVASNNLTLALKTLAGSDASASDPVYVNINGTIRTITAALSVTKNAGTAWAAAGSAELATKEIDWFAYLIWNTGPTPDVIDIGFSRIPYGRVYSDFSGTSTNERYLAYGNGTPPASTDDVCVIGRFAATLSAGAGYTWSVPTFTNVNLIQEPIFKTRWLEWATQFAGFSANPTNLSYYQVETDRLLWSTVASATGTSNATTATMTVPFASVNVTNLNYFTDGRGNDAGAECSAVFRVNANSATVDVFKGPGNTVWTNSGNKFFSGQGFYRLA